MNNVGHWDVTNNNKFSIFDFNWWCVKVKEYNLIQIWTFDRKINKKKHQENSIQKCVGDLENLMVMLIKPNLRLLYSFDE